MVAPLFFDELKLGDRWESRGRTVTEADVVNFACTTGDFDPLHVDHDFASRTPFRKPIAHGLLGLAWVAGLGSQFPAVQTLAFVRIRAWEFLKPVYFGDTLHVVNSIHELQPNGRKRGIVVWQRNLVNQVGTIVQQGFFETLVACRPPKPRNEASTSEPKKTNSELKKTRSIKKKEVGLASTGE